jgi:ATP-dependent DNA helicase RecG
VLQRARLQSLSKGVNPHVLIMTATPIPRSLTLTLFGDLSISVIRDMPPGRKPVATAVRTDRNRNKINRFLEEEMKAGRQIYCVAPVIDESKDGELKTATEMHERLSKTFPNRRVGMLHGRMDSKDRTKTMEEFVEGALDILACTTVIEVGVDVANATVMLIENAERFGLSQLHQLRGRVGRGDHKSYCILMYTPTRSDNARKRLDIMVRTNDGFKIAEKDLEIRGPGDFFGTRQSGMPSLRVGNIIRDVEILQKARRAAFEYIANDDPAVTGEKRKVIAAIERYWQRRYGLVLVG